MEPEEQRKSKITWGQLLGIILVVILILMALAGLSAPVILKSAKAADRTEAINNIKQIGALLLEFDTEYGNFPDNETAQDVKEVTKTDFILSGQYSNDYFRQMLADRKPDRSEKPFWCKTSQSPKKADDDFSTAAKALAAGEVGFSYIMASPTQGQSASGEPSRPVVVAPSYHFQPDWTFETEMGAGKAVVLRLDNSATAMVIRESDRKVMTIVGKTLGETGEGTPSGTKITPFLRAPQPR